MLGRQTLVNELDLVCYPTLYGDSSACFGTLHREGSGKVKHLQVKQLWLQAKIKSGELSFVKVPRANTPADSLAKGWGADGLHHFNMLDFSIKPPIPSHHHHLGSLRWFGSGGDLQAGITPCDHMLRAEDFTSTTTTNAWQNHHRFRSP